MFVLLMFFFLCLRGVVVVVGLLYLRLYSSTLHRTGETIWHFAAFVSRLLLLFLLNTFTTSDTTSMSATLTFNRISVKSVKRKREAVWGVSVLSDVCLSAVCWWTILEKWCETSLVSCKYWFWHAATCRQAKISNATRSVKVTTVILTDTFSQLSTRIAWTKLFIFCQRVYTQNKCQCHEYLRVR